ncbi:MAG: alpha/beta hydrolase, partial [Chloroflexi bacterium]|nr:alpha/beta hydrolase [Chloroflexota bacterium]
GLALGVIPAGLIYNTRMERAGAELYPPPARFITANGVRMHYLCDGDGDPPVVVLHDAPGSIMDAALLQPLLAERVRVCALDLPGYGWSEPLSEPAGLAATARQVQATLSALDVRRPILVGHALGGALALTLAADDPRGVRGLVLLDPTTPSQAGAVEREVGALARYRLLFPLGVAHLAESGTVRSLLSQRPSGTGDLSRPLAQQIASVNARLRALETLASSAAVIPGELAALESRLPSITTPTLILSASDLPPGPLQAQERLMLALPQATRETVEDSRHYVHIAQPEAVARRILLFADVP